MNTTKPEKWQQALTDLITCPEELLSLLELDQSAGIIEAAKTFPLKVPRGYVNRMQKGNPNDPLLRQVLPLGLELTIVPGYDKDPLQESQVNPVPGLLHKYHGRVLVTLTSACAIHCRFCFRRHFPYHDNNPGLRGWDNLFAYIQNDPSISEVILSGGDPLTVSDHLLKLFSTSLSSISHVKRLRIHTRLPIVLPERITASLLTWLRELELEAIVVVHANHPQEINEEVRDALFLLRNASVHLLNQTVLLKGINDEVSILALLSETLFDAGVLPYYLHVLDKVEGAAHFDLPIERARELHRALAHRLPGYLVPRLVCEEAGELAKTLV